MFCVNCGREIIDTARFCNYCGRPVQNIAPPPPVYPSQSMGQPYFMTSEAPSPMQTEQRSAVVHPETAESVSDASDIFAENDSEIVPGSVEIVSDNAFPNTDPLFSEKIPQTENNSQRMSANGTDPYAAYNPYPMPGSIPKSGSGSASGAYSMPMGAAANMTDPTTSVPSGASANTTTADQTTSVPPAAEKRERKYTLGHILLCLASTAIMAITAGVFAGLYFSVV